MVIAEKITRYLKRHKIYYQVLVHPEAFTCLEVAEREHVSGKSVAKVVIAKVRGKDTMLVLPATHVVDLLKLSACMGTQDVRIEDEKEFADLFPECEAGAMPPLAGLYKLPCCVDASIAACPEICFNAGTHQESIKIGTADFMRLVKGDVGDFAVLRKKQQRP